MSDSLNVLTQLLSLREDQRDEFDYQRIYEAALGIQFFKTLEQQNQEAAKKCAKALKLSYKNKGDYIFHFGDIGDTFYIILKGIVDIQVPTKFALSVPISYTIDGKLKDDVQLLLNQVERQNIQDILIPVTQEEELIEVEVVSLVKVSQLDQGKAFGELALLNNKPRAASIQCQENCIFGILRKRDYNEILGNIDRQKLSNKVQFFKQLSYFNSMGKNYLQKLSYYFTLQHHRKKQKVYIKDEAADKLYFIIKGDYTVNIKQIYSTDQVEREKVRPNIVQKCKYKTVNKKLAVRSCNEVFGDEEIFEDNAKRKFGCICSSNKGSVYFISKKDFIARVPLYIQQIFKQRANYCTNLLKSRQQPTYKSSSMESDNNRRGSNNFSFNKRKLSVKEFQSMTFDAQSQKKARLQDYQQLRLPELLKNSSQNLMNTYMQSKSLERKSSVYTNKILKEITKRESKRRLLSDVETPKMHRKVSKIRRIPPPNFKLSPKRRSQKFVI